MKSLRKILSTVLVVSILATMTVGFSGTATAASFNQTYESENAVLGTNTNPDKPFVTKMTSTTSLQLGSMTYTIPAGYSGTGGVALTNGPAQTADLITFNVTVPSAGKYDITFTGVDIYGGEARKNALFVNGGYWDYFYSGADSWASDVIESVYLKAGDNKLTIRKSATCDGNTIVDKISVKTSATGSNDFYNVEPVLSNPKSNDTTKRLFSYLCDVYGEKTLTGQFSESADAMEAKAIYGATGQMPAIMGFDLMNYTSCYAHYLPSNVQKLKTTQNIIDWVKTDGGIATVTWHWYAPVQFIKDDKWTSSFRTTSLHTKATADHPIYFSLKNIMGGQDEAGYNALIKDIDMIAAQLKILQNNGVTVLWRPLHEAGGNETALSWFWWGQDKDSYLKLWKLVYDRLTDVHDLNNLIWVWNGQNPDWYPGDNYCDIIGWDVYPEPFDYTASSNRFWQSTDYPDKHNKIVTLSENGTMPSLDQMIANNTMWSYFCTWSGEYVIKSSTTFAENYTSKAVVNALYNSDKTITLSELPSNLYTTYPIGKTTYTLTKSDSEKYKSPYGADPTPDTDTDQGDSDTDVEIPSNTITNNVIKKVIKHDGSYESATIDLLEICPALAEPTFWQKGVEVSFNFEVEGLESAPRGNGCGANSSVFVEYGASGSRNARVWSYDVNWAKDRNLAANKITSSIADASSPIRSAILKIENFQQVVDGDLDSLIDGKKVTVTIESLKIGGIEQVDPNGSGSSGGDDTDDDPKPVGAAGDINQDGNIDVIDAALLRAHIVQVKTLEANQLLYADLNSDGSADIIDVVMIRAIIVS